jgi:hypothetical protein
MLKLYKRDLTMSYTKKPKIGMVNMADMKFRKF